MGHFEHSQRASPKGNCKKKEDQEVLLESAALPKRLVPPRLAPYGDANPSRSELHNLLSPVDL